MKTKETVMGIFLAAVLILSGCQIGLHDGENPEAEDGTVLLRISAEGSEDVKVSRSVLPQLVLSDISAYELWGDSGTGMRNLATFDPVTITDATVALIPGTWDFSLRAYKLEDLILQGDLEDRDISASSNSLAFMLSPLTSGTGNIRITVNFPVAAGIAAAEAVSGEDDPEALTISGTGVTYTKTGVAAGNHFVSIRLLDSAGTLIGIVSELVVVRNNLLSEADVTLEPEDLRFTVLVPQGISAAAHQSNGTVLINWASIAGGVSYRVYRAEAAETEYAYIGETAAAPYADTTATAGVSYTYKVRGVNSNDVETQFSDVSEAVSALPGINGFAFRFPAAAGTIGSGTSNPITVSVPSIVNLTALAPVITHSGAAISPPSGVAQDFSSPVTYTVTAQDGTTKNYTVTVTPADATLNGALAWLQSNAEDEGQYTIAVNAGETLNPHTLSYSMKAVGITLKGRTSERTVTLGNSGSLFTIGAQVTLTLDDKLTLKGTINNASLVTVQPGGRLIMEQGSKITGNSAGVTGAGVYISANGGVTMNGGEISGNTASIADVSTDGSNYYSYGGGVYVAGGGTFTVNAGTISGNSASATTASSFNPYSYGGGVYVADGGTFTLNAGTVSGNSSSSSASSLYDSYSYGGGVYAADGGTFTLNAGTVSGNLASSYSYSYGGGVYMADGGTFIVNAGTISGNSASISNPTSGSYGGGVYVGDGLFTMTNGEIRNNTAYWGGGGFISGTATISDSTITGSSPSLYIANGSVTLSRGRISGSASYGVFLAGGAFVLDGTTVNGNTSYGVYQTGGTFTMNSGAISGHTNSGVYQTGGTFTLAGGTISNNTGSNGAGIYSTATLNLNGGEISSNTATNSGGGVYVSSSTANLTLKGTKITGNSTSSSSANGGGIYFDGAAFTMTDGEISGNRTAQNGGGVYIAAGTFKKSPATGAANSGIIRGSDDTEDPNIASVSGTAVYVSSVGVRNTTAGQAVSLDSTLSGATGGWE